MSLQTCWRCLSRTSDLASLARRPSQQPWFLLPASTATFTTSASLSALPPKKKSSVSVMAKPIRGAKQTFTKKKNKPQKQDRSRRPAIGERKALRKRIVLSNTNALEVQDMQDFSAQSIVDENFWGQVLGIPEPVVDGLRAVEAFKVTQGWSLFRRPAMLMRRDTLKLGKEIEEISQKDSTKSIRRVFVGERGCGKTLMLLQAMTMAMLKDWVVINIPDGIYPTSNSRNKTN